MSTKTYRLLSVNLSFIFLVVLSFSFKYSQARELTLKNEQIVLTLNENGVISIFDSRMQKSFAISNDNFLAGINGRVYTAKNTTAGNILETVSGVVYAYTIPDFTILIHYSLQPGCAFFSKQIEIHPDKDEVFTIDSLRVFDVAFKEKQTDYYIPRTSRPEFKANEYGLFLRYADATGLLMTVQNPFLYSNIAGQNISIAYHPDMQWKKEWGPFYADIGNVATYRLTGFSVPVTMVPEWKWTNGVVDIGGLHEDQAEIDAFTKIVNHYVLPKSATTVKLNVGWCENDYQIDISTPNGRTEYKRIIDQAAALGLHSILFAPSNSEQGSREEATDDWGWENLLWLSLGIKVRKGEWDPEEDKLPSSIQELLDYAKNKDVQFVSYLYPVLPFAGNPDWIVEGTPFHEKKRNASLGVRSFQDFLIKKLSSFYERTGIKGYSYDYTFLWYTGTSYYEQWKGWMRVKEALRKKYPDMIIDGRQLDQMYGPWSWLANSFPHPTNEDEQPESFVPFPDLHFDRVSADRQRYTAYRYRIHDYCPPVLMPGFMFHQTPRMDMRDGKPFLRVDGFRRRDWDYLGWKYSLFSSIATGGLNNVINMIPARDLEEMKYFSKEDKSFIRNWLNWTDTNRRFLLNTKFILGQPAFGKTDGTTALKNDSGFIFLFNPNARGMQSRLFLDESIGLHHDGVYTIRQLYPLNGKILAPPNENVNWRKGDLLTVKMDGASAVIFEIMPSSKKNNSPKLYNVQGKARVANNTLMIEDVKGKMGEIVTWKVLLTDANKISHASINGHTVSFNQEGNMVYGKIKFSGEPFTTLQPVASYEPDFTGGSFTASFKYPEWVKNQLKERRKQWPIQWTTDDYKTTWLVPERLLLYVQIAEPKDTMKVTLTINNQVVSLTKAYSSIRPNSRSFVGWYCDISAYDAGKDHILKLNLPTMRPGQFQGVFFENIEPGYTTTFKNIGK